MYLDSFALSWSMVVEKNGGGVHSVTPSMPDLDTMIADHVIMCLSHLTFAKI